MLADPHLDSRVESKLLERWMGNCLADSPEIFIDLGDAFMTDQCRGARSLQAKHYILRSVFILVSWGIVPPSFLCYRIFPSGKCRV